VGALRDLRFDGFDDGGVTVAGQGGAVAAVQVDVLVAVDVVDLRALAVAEPDRLRRGDLPAGGDAAGQVLLAVAARWAEFGWRRTKISSCAEMISLRVVSAGTRPMRSARCLAGCWMVTVASR
jgi:hypothetical protein